MSQQKARALRGALAAVLLAPVALVGTSPAQAAEDPDDPDELIVRISRITPAIYEPGDDVTVTGLVRNPERHAWTDVRVYPAVARTPFIARTPARAAMAAGPGYTGDRITAESATDELGTLQPGQSRRFSVTIRSALLGLSGADGVYPFGIHALATGPSGEPQGNAVGRANSFLPMRSSAGSLPAPTTVLWPFLLPGLRNSEGSYASTDDLAALISPRGQLRNLLDLALTTPRRGSDAIIDPSLLQAVQDITREPGESNAAAVRRRNAAAFLGDLVRLAEQYACAAVGFDQPDVLAVTASPSDAEFTALLRRATNETLDTYDLDCMRIEWPSPHGVDRDALTALEADGVDAVIVSPWAVPEWDGTRGNVLERRTTAGDQPLVVTDRLDSDAPGVPTAVTLRQAILSEAVFTSMGAGRDAAKTAAVVMVSPRFNPGTVTGQPLAAVYTADVTDPKNFAETVRERHQPYDGAIPDKADATPLTRRQMAAAADAAQTAQLLDGMLLEDRAQAGNAQLVARLVSERWRKHATTGLRASQHTSRQLSRELAAISVDGPEALTLSSGAGQFPVTLGNKTPHRVRVGLRIESSAPDVRFKAPLKVDVAAGESRTVTVDIDMQQETATTVTARLSAADGQEFGAATDFNVRSSQVGAALWVAIGVSVAFVAIALVRRFARPGHRPEHTMLPPEDFDD